MNAEPEEDPGFHSQFCLISKLDSSKPTCLDLFRTRMIGSHVAKRSEQQRQKTEDSISGMNTKTLRWHMAGQASFLVWFLYRWQLSVRCEQWYNAEQRITSPTFSSQFPLMPVSSTVLANKMPNKGSLSGSLPHPLSKCLTVWKISFPPMLKLHSFIHTRTLQTSTKRVTAVKISMNAAFQTHWQSQSEGDPLVRSATPPVHLEGPIL